VAFCLLRSLQIPIEPAVQTSIYARASAAISRLLCMTMCLRVCLFDCAIDLNRLDRLLLVDLASRDDDLNVI